MLLYFTMQSCFLGRGPLAFEVFVVGKGGGREIQNDSLGGRQKGDQPAASHVLWTTAMTWGCGRHVAENKDEGFNIKTAVTESNLEYSFFDIIMKRVLDLIVSNF